MQHRADLILPNIDLPFLFPELRQIRAELCNRLCTGSHLILYGPRGSGKSILLLSLREHFRSQGVPCGIAPTTSGLPDLVAALTRAYPEVGLDGLSRRTAKWRLWRNADQTLGVVLLDHVTEVTTHMVGFLRRLKGGISGVLMVADVDSERERARMRAWRAALSIRMPLMTSRQSHRYLSLAWAKYELPRIDAHVFHHIEQAARGRIGWLADCVHRLRTPDYWRDGRLHLAALCTDTEIVVRQSQRGPRLRRRFDSITPGHHP